MVIASSIELKAKQGDLITEALDGNFDIIAQGVNCFCTMGKGISVPMKKHFGCDTFPLEQNGYGDPNKLGQIDYREGHTAFTHLHNRTFVPSFGKSSFSPEASAKPLTVVNCYTQYRYGGQVQQLDYEALRLCLRKINMIWGKQGKTLGLPLIGGGLAGGNPMTILEIAYEELTDITTTIVIKDEKVWDEYFAHNTNKAGEMNLPRFEQKN